jgi:hypothetical protein
MPRKKVTKSISNKVKPLSPTDVELEKGSNVPDAVIRAVNILLKQKARDGFATILQKEIIHLAMDLDPWLKSSDLHERGGLDIEALYEKVGWSVTYDKPGFNENYEPTFEFQKKK